MSSMRLRAPDKLMRGSTTIRQAFVKFMEVDMPARIAHARTPEQWDIQDHHFLENITRFDAYDPFEVGHSEYPLMGCYVTGSSGFVRQDVTDHGNREYAAVYETTVFVAARTVYLGADSVGIDSWQQPGKDSAMQQRDDYMSLLRSALLEFPSLGTAGTASEIGIQENTIRESYPEPVKVADDRNPVWAAMGIINVNIRLTETLSSIPYGSADKIQVVARHVAVDRSIDDEPVQPR